MHPGLGEAFQIRSADLLSAVSPICNRQRVENGNDPRVVGPRAEYNSAIQQITNLRYGLRRRLTKNRDLIRKAVDLRDLVAG